MVRAVQGRVRQTRTARGQGAGNRVLVQIAKAGYVGAAAAVGVMG